MILECHDHLHRFESDGQDPYCPVCGCGIVRLAGRHASQVDIPDIDSGAPNLAVKIEEGRHAVGGGTWLDTKEKFVSMVAQSAPEMSEKELAACVKAWFPTTEETRNG